MATFDSGRQRYSMNFYASHQRPLQRRSYTGRPSRPAEGQLRVKPGPPGVSATRPLRGRKRNSKRRRTMSLSCQTRKSPLLFKYLVGAQQKRFGNREAERLGASQIDYQLEARRLLHRKIARLSALENLVHVGGGVANNFANVGT